ncbi:MAG: A24 family peptidase [Acidobacteriota bacterium]
MNPLILWPVFFLVALAAVIDLRTRRIPNWLTLPYLLAGVAANVWLVGWSGFAQSVEGILVALLLVGGLCWLRALGLGDLKLCAATGAWIGPSALLFALLMTAMAGGVMAIVYASWKGKLGVALDHTADLLWSDTSGRVCALDAHRLLSPGALTIPCAPAIAIGVIFSLFAS